MAEMALEPTLDMGDYLAAFKRRRGVISFVAGTVFLLGVIIAFVWPPTYKASATILIEEQEIPAELIQSTVTSYAAQRIQVISQRVMSRTNLMEIVEKYELYASERKRNTIEEVLSEMREDIDVEMITAEVMDPRTGRPAAATIAFTLAFESANPQQAQKVASELTTLYLNENLKSRTEKAAETYDFLTAESTRLSEEISRLEAKLAEFKERHINTLPELRDLNTQVLERTEREISEVDTQIRTLEERKIYLGGQLGMLDPYSSGEVLSPSARLDALRTEYIRLASRYSPDHPDVTSAKREIKALEIETGQYASADDLRAELDVLRKELSKAQQSYTDEHPDVKSLKRQITTLENDLKSPRPAPKQTSTPANADNPAYVTLQSQLAAANSEMRSLKAKRAQLTEKIEEYENRLFQTPKSEQEYRAITRDLDHASRRYQDIKAKQMTAEVGREMEKERKGERFTLIDPAILPEEPISPNRTAIIFLSLVLALGAGVGSAAIAESVDSTIRGTKGIVAAIHMAPLTVIPYMANAAETRAQRRKRIIIFASVIAGIVVLLLLVHFLVSPLDVLWFRGLRKVDNIFGE
jgi:succinoglycan biosynthesis transport protein ExoP